VKISVDVDLTPEEMRRLVGLPDVQTFNDNLMAKLQERMEAGVEGYDPMTLFQPYLRGTQAGMELFNRMMSLATGAKPSAGRDGTDKNPQDR